MNTIGSAQTSPEILEGGYILILPVVLITPTHMLLMTCPNLWSHYPPSVWRLIQSLYNHTFSACVLHPSHVYRYMNIMLLSYVDYYKYFKVTNVSIYRTPFLTYPSLKMYSPLWRKYIIIKTSQHGQDEFTFNVSVLIWLYTLCPIFNI